MVEKIALVNGSPKGEKSASRAILSLISQSLPEEQYALSYFSLKTPQVDSDIAEQILEHSILLIAFPLYVDGVPSHMLRWLMELERTSRAAEGEKPVVYALINCGFYEAEQNKVVLEILRNWCAKSNFRWGQGMAIGAGGVIGGLQHVPLGKWPLRRLGQAMGVMGESIRGTETAPDIFVSPDFPRIAYKLVAEFGWRRSIRRNGLKLRDLHRRVPWAQNLP
ncbi:MAG: NAD(P)H-dependent oxidoreductase [Firmicutes bacterium]|nr:NAD(P)H-dependent oxidoreductase [Bacillota bacterium]